MEVARGRRGISDMPNDLSARCALTDEKQSQTAVPKC